MHFYVAIIAMPPPLPDFAFRFIFAICRSLSR